MFTLNLLSILAYSVYWFKGDIYGFSKYTVIYFANSHSCEFIFQIFITLMVEIVVVKSFSHVLHFATPWTAACQASLSFINSQSLLKFMFIESVMPSNHLILCHSLLLLPSIFPSIRVFSNESILPIRWPKYWNFSVSPSSEHSGLISLRIGWFDLLAVQGTLKSLLQHHSSKASVRHHSAFFILQFSHWYMTTGKTRALTVWTFVGKVMSLFSMCCLGL